MEIMCKVSLLPNIKKNSVWRNGYGLHKWVTQKFCILIVEIDQIDVHIETSIMIVCLDESSISILFSFSSSMIESTEDIWWNKSLYHLRVIGKLQDCHCHYFDMYNHSNSHLHHRFLTSMTTVYEHSHRSFLYKAWSGKIQEDIMKLHHAFC